MSENQNYLDQYIDAVSKLPSLDADQINTLVTKFQSGETHHSDRLLAQYAQMIRGIITTTLKKYEHAIKSMESPVDELFNQSVVTFMTCLSKFEVSRGLHLSTYLFSSISFALGTFCKKQSNLVNPWVNVKWTRVANHIYRWIPKHKTIDQVQLTCEDAKKMSKAVSASPEFIMDVFAQLKHGEGDAHLDDISYLISDNSQDLVEDADRHSKIQKITECVNNLVDARSKFIIKKYFLSNKSVSIQSIAEELNMSPRNVRNHINKVVAELKSEFGLEVVAA